MWRLVDWPVAGDESVDNAAVVSLPRAANGATSESVSFEARVARHLVLEYPGEFVLDHVPEAGASGSPVMAIGNGSLKFAGLVTSAIQGGGETQCSVVRAGAILSFVEAEFPT